MARYIDGLKMQIRDKIGVTVLRNMSEAKNMALRAELMLNEKSTRFDGGNHRCGVKRDEHSRESRVVAGKEKNIVEKPSGSSDKKEERAMEKRPMEFKEAYKQTNPYAKPILG